MAKYSDVFSHWKLESIDGEGPMCTIRHHIGAVLARYIPSLVWVCGINIPYLILILNTYCRFNTPLLQCYIASRLYFFGR